MRIKVASFAILLLYAASCDRGTTGPPPPPARAASVTITPDSISVEIRTSLQLHAVVRDANGGTVTTYPVSWSSADTTTATVDGLGRVRAVRRGKTTIRASADTAVGSAPAGVVAAITGLSLGPPSIYLAAEDSFRVSVVMQAADSGPPTDSTLRWGSTDSVVATVSPTGVIHAKRAGTAFIAATTPQQLQATTSLTVRSRVGSISITPADTNIYVFDFVSHVVVARGAVGDTVALLRDICIPSCWGLDVVKTEHSNPAVASLQGCCTVISKDAGVDTLIATADNIVSRSAIHVASLAFDSVSISNYAACGLLTDHSVRCWGAGHPTAAARGMLFSQVSHGCGLTLPGSVSCFSDTSATPLAAPQSVELSVGGNFMCARTASSGVWCSGSGIRGQLGDGSDTAYRRTAAPVTGGHSFTAITAGVVHACALSADSSAYCWGSNEVGQLGIGDTIFQSNVPLAVAGGLKFIRLSANIGHTCGIASSGEAYCWGLNYRGQLGTGDNDSSRVPRPVAGGLHFTSIAAGITHTCAIATDGSAYCWGAAGTLGSVSSDSPTPQLVPGGLVFQTISASLGGDFSVDSSCGTTSDGVYCWGLGITGVDGVPYSFELIKVQGQQ